MAEISFDESLVVVIDEPGSCTDVEKQLAGVLFESGYVRESYAQAIVDREASYPTGLEFGEHSIAMPHCDIQHVNSPAICMAVLKKPVAWHRMDDPESTCNAELVIMLALNEAHAHLEMLQKVVALLQNQDLVAEIVSSGSAAEAYSLAKDQLL